MEENIFNASLLEPRLVVDSVVASDISWPVLPAETRSTSRTLPQIGREANLLFKAVDILGIVPNQLSSITQTKDEAMYSCWTSAINDLAHLSNAIVEERPPFRIRKNRRVEKTTMTEGIDAIFRSKVLSLVRGNQEGKRGIPTGIPAFMLMPAPVTVIILDAAPNRLAMLCRWRRSPGRI